MSKNERVKTRSAKGTVRAKTSANTFKNIKKLNVDGCRLLACRVIKSGYEQNDLTFFEGSWFHFWAALAYNVKTDYKDEELADKVRLNIEEQERALEKKMRSKRGRTPHWI